MLVLMFEAAGHRYALETRDVVEVVPWVQLQHVAGSPDYVAGYLSHRGEVIPAIDPGRLACGTPCQCRFNSRLIILDVPSPAGVHRVGLLAERVSTAQLQSGGNGKTGAWGPLLLDEHGLFQLIELRNLLPPERLDAFAPARITSKE
jgi:chemotaxis-related protein WspB